MESVCSKLHQQDAEELRANINRVLRPSHPFKPNLTKVHTQAYGELKRNRNRLVQTADKGIAMVIMDRQDYINKSNQLFALPAYRDIPMYPTNKIKTKLINILKRVKNQTGLEKTFTRPCIQWVAWLQNFMVSLRSTNRTPPQAYSVLLWISHLWFGQGTYQNTKTFHW